MNFNQVYGQLVGDNEATRQHLRELTLYEAAPIGSHPVEDQLQFCVQLLGLCSTLYENRRVIKYVYTTPLYTLGEQCTDCHWLALVYHANRLAEQCLKEIQQDFQLDQTSNPTPLFYAAYQTMETVERKAPFLRHVVGLLFAVKQAAVVCVWVRQFQQKLFAQLQRRYLTIRIVTIWYQVRRRLPAHIELETVQLQHPRNALEEGAIMLMTCAKLSETAGWIGKVFGRCALIEAYLCTARIQKKKLAYPIMCAYYTEAQRLGWTAETESYSKVSKILTFNCDEVQKERPRDLLNCVEKGEIPQRYF